MEAFSWPRYQTKNFFKEKEKENNKMIQPHEFYHTKHCCFEIFIWIYVSSGNHGKASTYIHGTI